MALEEEDMSLTLAGKLSRNVYVLRGTHRSSESGDLPSFGCCSPKCLINL